MSRRGGGLRHLEFGIRHRNVDFDAGDGDLFVIRGISGSAPLDGEREIDPVHPLIGTEIAECLTNFPAHKHQAFGAYFQESIRIEKLFDDVSIFQRDFEEESIVAIDRLMADVLDP